MNTRHLIHRFYDDAWNRWNDTTPDEILAEDFTFRGSLGDEVLGRDGWRSYRDKIRAAVPDFHNEVVDLVVAGERAAARLYYSGHQRGELLGTQGTGNWIEYAGAAFFTARVGFLTEAWVLGDLDTLRRQLP
jgi:predicted ester cyclase